MILLGQLSVRLFYLNICGSRTFPNAFVVNYTEDFGNTEGVGTFQLNIKQKKDKLANIAIEGGYPAA